MQELAKITLLSESRDAHGRKVTQSHCPAGLYVAGAGARQQERDSYLATRHMPDGTTCGRYYRKESDARAHFARLRGV